MVREGGGDLRSPPVGPRPTARRHGAPVRWLAAALALWAASCGEEEHEAVRAGRFGSLRDLVLFERSDAEGGDFFLDRFEVTRADWAEWLEATGVGVVDRPAASDRLRPVAGVSLPEARRFAAWRLCRIQRWAEWQFAASDRDRSLYPWGDTWYPTYANTADLGLFKSTLVGTFESGRRGAGPYDLIGNIAEWTESPPPGFFGGRFAEPPKADWFQAHVESVRAHPALRPWLLGSVPLPSVTLQLSSPSPMPRLVVGWSFAARVAWPPPLDDPTGGWQRSPSDRSESVGLRLAVRPLELLQNLFELEGRLSEDDRAALMAFLARGVHRDALLRAFEGWRRAPRPRGEAGEAVRRALAR